jgi:heme A synthase
LHLESAACKQQAAHAHNDPTPRLREGIAKTRMVCQAVIHRALSLLVLAVNVFVLIRAFDQENKAIRKNAQLAGILVLAEIAVGFSFMLFDMPKFLQPTHLMLACFLFAVQTKLFFVINRK